MKKPSFEALNIPSHSSFLIRSFEGEFFKSPYHFHPEYELTFIVKGKGRRFVGRNMDNYDQGDLVLLGPDLPHCWKTEAVVAGEMNAHSIVIQFSKDFLGEQFLLRPEMCAINTLLDNSCYGLKFSGITAAEVSRKIQELSSEEKAFKRVILLLEILDELANSTNSSSLSREYSPVYLSLTDRQRIHPVLAYIVENFQGNVSLHDAASLANMSSTAFCKYFKRVTQKTFLQVVFDYRIKHATEELVNTTKPVHQICFESGFPDVSQFHKVFRKLLKISPLAYRNKFKMLANSDL